MTLLLFVVIVVGAIVGALYARGEVKAGLRCPYCSSRFCRHHRL